MLYLQYNCSVKITVYWSLMQYTVCVCFPNTYCSLLNCHQSIFIFITKITSSINDTVCLFWFMFWCQSISLYRQWQHHGYETTCLFIFTSDCTQYLWPSQVQYYMNLCLIYYNTVSTLGKHCMPKHSKQLNLWT